MSIQSNNINKFNMLKECHVKLDKAEKRMLRLTVRLHAQFFGEMTCYIMCVCWINLVLYVLSGYPIWILFLLVLGGIGMLYKKVTPVVGRLCNEVFWKILKFKIVKSNYYVFLFFDIASKAYLGWCCLDYYLKE